MQNPDLSTTNTTMSPLLSTKLWSGLNIAKKIVCLSSNLKILTPDTLLKDFNFVQT